MLTRQTSMISLALFFSLLGSSAWSCPDPSKYGETYTFTGGELFSPAEISVMAGGENSIQTCGKRLKIIGEKGFFTTPPDFTIQLSEVGNYKLAISVKSECDSALLVNTPDEIWFYDDDSYGDLDPKLSLTNVPDGYLDIWVGTYDGQYCNAILELETF